MTMQKLRSVPLEAYIWILALIGLGIFGPSMEGHVTFCIPTLLGFDGCWGCGIGRSIGHALHGDFVRSWNAHPLGMPAIVILLIRIVTLLRSTPTFAGGSHGKRVPISA